jgi:hypothetical protein
MRWARQAAAVILCVSALALPACASGVMSALYFGESTLSLDQRAFGMGGAGLGATGGYPDAVNPASLARSGTAAFNLTYRPLVNWGRDGIASQRLTSGRLSSGVFSLPVWRYLTVGLSIEQLHSSQYRYAEACSTESGDAYTRRQTRSGGVYAGGLSMAALPMSGLGIGVGWRWTFGSIRQLSELDFRDSNYQDTQDELLQKHSGGYPALGAVWDGGTIGFGAYWRGATTGDGEFTLRTTHDLERNTGFEFTLPQRFGVGVGIGPFKGCSFAADLWREQWSKADFEGESSSFRDVTSLSIGAEYLPHFGERRLPPLRLGYRHRPGYYLLPLPDGSTSVDPPPDEAFTVGTMLGTGEGRGIVQVGVAFGTRGGVSRYGVRERYLEASLGFTGFEPWTRRSLPGA